MAEMSVKNRFRLAVEDRFIIINLKEDYAMLPDEDMAWRLATTISSLSPEYTIICDTREVKATTSDLFEMAEAMSPYNPTFIDYEDNRDWIYANFGLDAKFLPIKEGELPVKFEDVNLLPFDKWDSEFVGTEERRKGITDNISLSIPDYTEWELANNLYDFLIEVFPTFEDFTEHCEATLVENAFLIGGSFWDAILGRRLLQNLVNQCSKNSLLVQYAFQYKGDELTVTPYHGHALHSIESESELIIARPGILAKQTQSLFHTELNELERILKEPKQRELIIQRFMENHRQIFHALGYTKVYSQVILEREDGTSLRPDFILEPIGDEWCDILDLKLPNVDIVVGRRDRKTFASAIHELAAQLREYGAYFENEIWSKRIEEKFGVKCYRPRLIGVVGSNPADFDSRQIRRLMTSYSDINIMTFDKLFEIAKNRLLI